jgi:hypothetical protein
MSASATRPSGDLAWLLAELHEIHAGYGKVLSASPVRNIDPGRVYRLPLVGLGGGQRGNPKRRASRCYGLSRGWGPRFRMLFPRPAPAPRLMTLSEPRNPGYER